MNFNTFNVSVTPCIVCAYSFSDKHHIWPQAKGGKLLPTILLCPNHHRFANLVQAMLLRSMDRLQIEAFAQQYFDPAFNTIALQFLIEEQERLGVFGWATYAEQREQEARANPESALAAAKAYERGWRARLEHMRPDEPIPTAEYQEALAHVGAVLSALDALERVHENDAAILPQPPSTVPITQEEYQQALAQIESLLSLHLVTLPMAVDPAERASFISEAGEFFAEGYDREYPAFGKVLRQMVDALEATE
jgi:hypothetical protein